MSWCISIVINEESKEEALKLLDKAVSEIKTNDEIFVDGEFTSFARKINRLPRLKYDSYKGI